MKKKLLIGPFAQIVTMDGLKASGHLSNDDLKIVRNAGVLIHEGKIAAIDNFEKMRQEECELHEIDFPAVLIPGLIDAHTHLCFAGTRVNDYVLRLEGASYTEIAANKGGILETVRQTRAATQDQLVELMLMRTSLLIEQGVTTVEVKSGYGLNVKDEIKMLRAIHEAGELQPVQLIPTCLGAHTLSPEFDSPVEYLNYLLQDLLPNVKKLGLSNRVDICVDKCGFAIDKARSFIKIAQDLGFATVIHADQFIRGGATLAAEMHALSADHLEASTEEDFTALKLANVIPIVLPGASLGLGMPYAPAKAILDHDLPLVIASDWNPGSAPMGQLLLQASLLGISEKLTIAETLAAITVRAAKALQLEDRGVLKVGMRADMVVYPTADYREILYYQGSLSPAITIIHGQPQTLDLQVFTAF